MKLSASKCGLRDADVRRLMTFPVATSARYNSMLNKSRLEKKATRLPSGLTAGATFCAPSSSTATTARPTRSGGVREAASAYCALIAACHCLLSESEFIRRIADSAVSHVECSAFVYRRTTMSSPYVPPMYAHNAWPYRYGKYLPPERSLIVGRSLRRIASRSHIAVFGSLR